MDPQDYAARAEYRPPATWYRRLNRVGVPLTWLGLAPRDAVTLEVRGRVLLRAAPEPSLDDVTTVASYYPVFRIIYEQQT